MKGERRGHPRPQRLPWLAGFFSPLLLGTTGHRLPHVPWLGSPAPFTLPSPLETTHASSPDDHKPLPRKYPPRALLQAPFSSGTAPLSLKWGPKTHAEKIPWRACFLTTVRGHPALPTRHSAPWARCCRSCGARPWSFRPVTALGVRGRPEEDGESEGLKGGAGTQGWALTQPWLLAEGQRLLPLSGWGRAEGRPPPPPPACHGLSRSLKASSLTHW